MITVTVSKHKDQFRGFTLSGHAGFRRFGKDIICAAVSVLVINTANSIEQFTDDHFILDQAPDGGYICMSFDEDNSKELKLLLDSMILGLKEIEKKYGSKYVLLQFEEV